MDTLKELYKIGYGPSSSHTMGPQFASKRFLERNEKADRFVVELYGSLALTGKGHLTDEIIYQTLGRDRTEVKFRVEVKDPDAEFGDDTSGRAWLFETGAAGSLLGGN